MAAVGEPGINAAGIPSALDNPGGQRAVTFHGDERFARHQLSQLATWCGGHDDITSVAALNLSRLRMLTSCLRRQGGPTHSS